LPGALAYVTIAAELGAGMLLIAGFATRWVALATVPLLLGAAWVHVPNAGCSARRAAAGNTRCS